MLRVCPYKCKESSNLNFRGKLKVINSAYLIINIVWYFQKKCDIDIYTIFLKWSDNCLTIYRQTIFWGLVLRVPSPAGCQFLEGPLTCLDVMWSLFWSKLDLKMKIWPTSGRFGENCLLKLVLVCPILTQWWNKKNLVYFPFKVSAEKCP